MPVPQSAVPSLAPRRVVLLAAAGLILVATMWVGTADVHQGASNCGSALVARDPTNLLVGSGDQADDDEAAALLRQECGRVIQRQRVVVGLMVAAAVTVAALSTRGPRRRSLPGDPVV